MSDIPEAWDNLIQAIILLARGQTNEISPFHCEHDTLTVMSDPESFSPAEIIKLEEWGFHSGPEDGTFTSYRYGSA